jgi:hypothetical protein
MKSDERFDGSNDYLRRLPAECYRGQAYIHWSMTIEDRKTGWLIPIFYYKFRELLTHTMFRYGLCCPICCCMPDHFHLLWVGISDDADQRDAVRFFRKQLNPILEKLGVGLQSQPYDRILREEERERHAFEDVAEYIARNPERAGLVKLDCYREYSYTGCLIPGYPELTPWQSDYWERFWRTYSYLRKNGVSRISCEAPENL